MIRNKIWYNLVNSKFKCYYMSYSIDKYQKRSIFINSFLAIISILSVSAWAIWEILPLLWAFIIGISNILIAIKPFLHYDKKIKELNEKLTILESIQIEFEKLFYELDIKKINEEVASNGFFIICEKQIKVLRKSDELLLGTDNKIKKKADADTDRNIYNNYKTKC